MWTFIGVQCEICACTIFIHLYVETAKENKMTSNTFKQS